MIAGRVFGRRHTQPMRIMPASRERIVSAGAEFARTYVRGNAAGHFAIRSFTLVELVVSIGVLGLLMALTGSVFKMSADSTGQAKALMDISQSVALLEQTLREDLANVDPKRSMMIIAAHPINAYWTKEHSEANGGAPIVVNPPGTPYDYPHDADPEREVYDTNVNRFVLTQPRADVLMFFTSKRTNSFVMPNISSDIVQVVYGAAHQGELDAAGTWTMGVPPAQFPRPSTLPDSITFVPYPAQTWHLARRSVLIVDAPDAALGGTGLPTTLLMAELNHGISDIVTNDVFQFEAEVVGRSSVNAPSFIDLGATGTWLDRSRMDLTPPAQLAYRLGHYLLPNCASFKVEWAIDLREHVDFAMPGAAPLNELIWLDSAKIPLANQPLVEFESLAQRYDGVVQALADRIRFVGNEIANRFAAGPTGFTTDVPVWYANDMPNPGGSLGDPDRYFPVALRITVDMFDKAGRLDKPLRYVMVLPVGDGG